MSGCGFAAMWRVAGPKEWPQAPSSMSLSRLYEIEQCPRRWALSSAKYPDIWEQPGYPGKPQLSTMQGKIVHSSLKSITVALSRAGCHSIKDPHSIAVLRELGGYTQIITACTKSILSKELGNPRAERIGEIVERSVLSKLPEMRECVQTLLSKVRLQPQALHKGKDRFPSHERSTLKLGSHPEVLLRASKLGWIGFADLINLSAASCEIVDFKTGEPKEEHAFQLRVYSLLWALDTEINPSARLADTLTLSYRKGEVRIPAPSFEEIQSLERDLTIRTRSVNAALAVKPPEAKPALEACCYCSVRHLCDDYWKDSTQLRLSNNALLEEDAFGDIELTITDCHGPASWDAIVEIAKALPKGQKIVLRTALDESNLKAGDRIRVLDAYLTVADEEGPPAVVTMSSLGEIFLVEGAKLDSETMLDI